MHLLIDKNNLTIIGIAKIKRQRIPKRFSVMEGLILLSYKRIVVTLLSLIL